MKTILKWFAGFFEDQKGTASSKRAGFYWAFGLLTYMVVKGTVNMEMFWGIVGIVLTLGGFVTTEFFKKLQNDPPVTPPPTGGPK
jgi:hypothetical protein